jgi:nucleotide-binding universal stress UspA family protein
MIAAMPIMPYIMLAGLRLVSPAAVAQMIRNNEKRLAELGKDVARTYQIKVKALPMPSMVEEELEKLVAQHDAELVVMDIQNKLAENKILGNTTTTVTKSATYPVLVVPFGAEFDTRERILFARDEKPLHEKIKV